MNITINIGFTLRYGFRFLVFEF